MDYLIHYPMTDPWCCYIWCSMDPINKTPLYVSINIQAHHGSVMGIEPILNNQYEPILTNTIGLTPILLTNTWIIRFTIFHQY